MKTASLRFVSAVALLVTMAFAGCTSEPRAREVDFSEVDSTQPGGSFTLRVKVVGIGNETEPLAGAFVGAAQNFQAIAKSTTDEQGEAVLKIRKDQTIRVVAKADGWTTEDSGEILIGDADEDKGDCGSFTIDVQGHSQSQTWCVVTDSSDSAAYRLDGREGRVSIVLLRKEVSPTFQVPVGPHANALVVVLPDGKSWSPQLATIHADPDIQRLYMNRLVETRSTLSWKNSMLEQGDFELGVGCSRDAPAARTSNNVPYLTQQSNMVSVIKDWNPKAKGTWADCDSFFAGPIVDTVNSQITTTVLAKMVFKGQSRIIPVNV